MMNEENDKIRYMDNKIMDMVAMRVDDEVYYLTKRIQTDFELNWEQARDITNWALRKLFLDYLK